MASNVALAIAFEFLSHVDQINPLGTKDISLISLFFADFLKFAFKGT